MDRDTTQWVNIIVVRTVHAAFISFCLFLMEVHVQMNEHVQRQHAGRCGAEWLIFMSILKLSPASAGSYGSFVFTSGNKAVK